MSRANDTRGTAADRTARRRRQRSNRRQRFDLALEAYERVGGVLTTLRDLLGASLMPSVASLDHRAMVERAVKMLETELVARQDARDRQLGVRASPEVAKPEVVSSELEGGS